MPWLQRRKETIAREEKGAVALWNVDSSPHREKVTNNEKRGGKSSWKNSVRRRYNRDLRRQKQRKQRRQAVNRQIWQRLQALEPRAEETATSLLQLAKTVEERTGVINLVKNYWESNGGRHWVAIGGDEAQETTNAGRKVQDGILFRVTVSIAGRNCAALIDSGASPVVYCT